MGPAILSPRLTCHIDWFTFVLPWSWNVRRASACGARGAVLFLEVWVKARTYGQHIGAGMMKDRFRQAVRIDLATDLKQLLGQRHLSR